MSRIGFVGMSHLGVNHAAAAAEKGFTIVGYDPDASVIAQLNNHTLDFNEPNLASLLESNKERLTYTGNINDLKDCDVVYVSKDVPTDDKGQSDLRVIDDLVDKLTKAVSSKTIIVILCQVCPGYTRSIQFDSSRLYYQVETLIFGQAVDRALHPERFIIGCNDPKNPLPKAFEDFLKSHGCALLPMRYESAELAKISINLFLVSQVSTSNVIAEICEKIGADWFEIQESLRLDRRIGKYAYLNPGLGIAGGNLERDLSTTLQLSYKNGTKSSLVDAWLDDCSYRRDWVLKTLFQNILPKYGPKTQIGVLGLSYKPDTSSIKNSPSMYLLEKLKEFNVVAYDPAVTETPFPSVRILDSAKEVCQSEILILMTPWQEFKEIDLDRLSQVEVLLDPYNLYLNKVSGNDNQKFYYKSIGRS